MWVRTIITNEIVNQRHPYVDDLGVIDKGINYAGAQYAVALEVSAGAEAAKVRAAGDPRREELRPGWSW